MHRSTQLENTELWGLPYSVVGWKEGTLEVSFFKENNILFYIQKIHKVGVSEDLKDYRNGMHCCCVRRLWSVHTPVLSPCRSFGTINVMIYTNNRSRDEYYNNNASI